MMKFRVWFEDGSFKEVDDEMVALEMLNIYEDATKITGQWVD